MTITKEQRARRRDGIFSSDCPRIMNGEGVRVALEKLGELEPENLDDVPEIQLGNLIEPRILDAYERQESVKLVHSPDTMRHATHQWLGAHLDAMLPEQLIVESKSVGWYNRNLWGEPNTDEIPDRVMWQVQEQMAVARIPVTAVAVCFLTEAALVAFATGNPPPIDVYVVPADKDLEAYIVERCGKVWQSVEARTLPEPEQPLDARLIYRRDTGAIVEATEDIFKQWSELIAIRQTLKTVTAAEDDAKARLQAFIRDASELRYRGMTLATWRKEKDRAAYTVAAREGSRKLLIKEIK